MARTSGLGSSPAARRSDSSLLRPRPGPQGRRANLRRRDGREAGPRSAGSRCGRAPARKDLEGPQHHGARRVVQDEGRDQPGPALLREEVHGRDHLPVVGAVEGGEQGLERAEVERRQVGARLDRSLSKRRAEEVEIEPLEVGGPGDPHERERGRGARQHDVPPAQHHLGKDQERGEGLTSTLAHEVDEGLGPRPEGVGQRHVEQLAAGAVERVAEGAVGPLQQQGRDEPAAQGDSGGAQEEQGRQRPESAVEAQDPEEPVGQQELGHEGEGVQDEVEGGEEGPEVFGGNVPRDHALEHVVAQGQGHGGDEHEDGQRPHVGVALAGAGSPPGGSGSSDPRGAARPRAARAQEQRRAHGGRRHRDRRREHQDRESGRWP